MKVNHRNPTPIQIRQLHWYKQLNVLLHKIDFCLFLFASLITRSRIFAKTPSNIDLVYNLQINYPVDHLQQISDNCHRIFPRSKHAISSFNIVDLSLSNKCSTIQYKSPNPTVVSLDLIHLQDQEKYRGRNLKLDPNMMQ